MPHRGWHRTCGEMLTAAAATKPPTPRCDHRRGTFKLEVTYAYAQACYSAFSRGSDVADFLCAGAGCSHHASFRRCETKHPGWRLHNPGTMGRLGLGMGCRSRYRSARLCRPDRRRDSQQPVLLWQLLSVLRRLSVLWVWVWVWVWLWVWLSLRLFDAL